MRLSSVAFVLLIFFLVPNSLFASPVYLQNLIAEQDDTSFSASAIGYSRDGEKLIFTSNSSSIPGFDGPANSSSQRHLYFRDQSTGIVTRITKDQDGQPMDVNVQTSSVTRESNANRVYFRSWLRQQHQLYYYSFDTDTVTELPFSTNSWPHMLASQNDDVYVNVNGQISSWSVQDSSLTPLQATPRICSSDDVIKSVSDNGLLLFNHCNALYTFEPATQEYQNLHALLPGLPLGDNPVTLSADGNTLILVIHNIVYRYDLKSASVTTLHLEKKGFSTQGTYEWSNTNRDGSLVFLKLQQRNVISKLQGSQVLSWQKPFYGVIDFSHPDPTPVRLNIVEDDSSDGWSEIEVKVDAVRHDPVNNTLLVTQEFADRSHNASWFVAIDDLKSLRTSIPENSAALDVSNSAPHRNQVSIIDADNSATYKIRRRSEKSGLARFFWTDERSLEDFEMGLQTGINHYQVYSCDANLDCSATSSPTVSLGTQDFINDGREHIIVNVENDELEPSLEIGGLDWEGTVTSTIIEFQDKDHASAYQPTQQVYTDQDKIKVGVRPCASRGENCSDWTSIQTLDLPELPQEPFILLDTEYRYVSVWFDENEQYQYHLERAPSPQYNAYQTIAQDIQSGWRDESIVPGEEYKYRLVVCDPSNHYCRLIWLQHGRESWQTDKITIERQRNLRISLRNSSNDTGSLSFNIHNYYDVDSFIVSRGLRGQEFQEIATLPGYANEFTDPAPLLGVSRWYRVQSVKNNKIFQTTSIKGDYSRDSEEDMLSESAITGFTMDDSTAWGTMFSWDPVPGVHQYILRITQQTPFSSPDELRIVPTETSYFVPFDDINFNELTSYSLTPVFLECRDELGYCAELEGAPTIIKNVSHFPSLQNKPPVAPSINTAWYEPDSVEISFRRSFVFDSYKVSRKTINSQTWQTIYYNSDGYSDYDVTFEDRLDLVSNSRYQYRLEACSLALETCATSLSDTVNYNTNRVSGPPPSPVVTVMIDRFQLTLPEEPDGYYNRIEIAASRNGDSFNRTSRVIRRPDDRIDIDFHPFYHRGNQVSFKLRYCFDEPVYGSRHDPECSEYSEAVTGTVPTPRYNMGPHFEAFNIYQDVSANENILSARFGESATSPPPLSVVLYRASNSEALVAIDSRTNSEQDPIRNYSFTDKNLTLDTWYEYGIRACNAIECEYRTISPILYSNKEPELPSTPVVTFVSQDLDPERIRLEIERSSTADQYHIYRANEEQGDYRQVKTLFDTENQYIDYVRQPSSVYWYQVEACNVAGCVRTEPFSGSTRTNFHSGGISIDNASLYQYWNTGDTKIALSGTVSPQFGLMDVFTGALHFNQWLDLTEGMQIDINAYLYGNWSECIRVLDYSLHLPNFGRRQNKESYDSRIGSILYTGNGCSDNEELELFSFYFDAEYLSTPVKIDLDLRETWNDYRLTSDANGTVVFYINDVEIARTDTPLDMQVFNLSQMRVNLRSSSYYSSGLQSFSFNTGKDTDLNNSLLLSHYTSEDDAAVASIHPRVIAIDLRNYADGRIEYRPVEDRLFGESQDMQLKYGGKYNAYIQNLAPDREHQFFMRYCQQNLCGPYHYVNSLTRGYQEINNAPPIAAQLSRTAQEVHISLTSRAYSASLVDTFTFYKQTQNIDDEPVELLSFEYSERHEHWLQNEGEYLIIDSPEPETTVNYSLEVCNPLGCSTSPSQISLDIPGDADNDGVYDPYDSFPEDPNESSDNDRDGIGDNADPDDDNDNIPDLDEIALGLDPLNRWDGSSDLDSDGFSNFYEFYVGTDLADADSNPEQEMEFYTRFQTEEERAIAKNAYVFQFGNVGTYAVGGIIEDPFEPNITVRITGQLRDGYLVFTEDFNTNRKVSIHIDGREIVSSTANFLNIDETPVEPFKSSPKDFFWRHVAYPVTATSTPVTIELSFYSHEKYPNQIMLHELFIPLSSPLAAVNHVAADFDGDQQTDFVLRNREIGVNYALSSKTGTLQRHALGNQENDIILDGDFDGDGIADVAVRRPGNTTWYVKNSGPTQYNSDRQDGVQRIRFGTQEGDIPVPADYDGDGITDFAVRRPDTHMWYIQNSDHSNYRSERQDGIQRVRFGRNNSDIPVPADYDGDGKADIAVRRPQNHMWYILESSTNEIRRVQFGKQSTDIPVPADYDGDGKADLAVRRPESKMWYILRSSDEQIMSIRFGLQESDIPVVGDYDGDGIADVAVRRPDTSMWYVLKSSDNQIIRQEFGRHSHMVPALAPIWQKLLMSGWQNDYLFGVPTALLNGSELTEDEISPLIMITPVDDEELGINDRIIPEALEYDDY